MIRSICGVLMAILLARVDGAIEFPRIPYIKRIKMPSFDDILQEQAKIKHDNEINSWSSIIHH